MKRTLAFLLAVIMCLSIVPIGAYATEETAETLNGWTAEDGFYLDTAYSYQGQGSLGHTGAQSTATSPEVLLEADTEYLVSAYVRSENASSSATVSLGGVSASSKTYGDWEKVSFIYKGNGVAETITVTANGDVAVDAITVCPLELGEELVTNGSFDNGFDGWRHAVFTYVDGEVNGHSGVMARTATGIAVVRQPGVKVQADTWYLYSADMYATATENFPRVYIDMNDTVGETQLIAPIGGEWCTVYGLWYSGSNAATDVRAVVENAFAGSTTGTAYVDNISFRPVIAGEQLVADSGFENSGWQLGDGAAYQSDSYYLYGAKSLKLTDNATALANGGKAIAVEPYTYYDISAFSFRPGDKSVTGKIALQSADGTELASITGLYYNQTSWAPIPGTHAHYNKYGHWERIVGRWYSGDNTEIYLAAKTEGTGTVYFDEVTLRAYEDCFPSDNIFRDGHFEKEITDVLNGWTAESGFYLDAIWTYEGRNALGHTGAQSTVTSPEILLEKDTEYLVSAYVHSENAASSATVSLGGVSASSKTYGDWEKVYFVCKGSGNAEKLTVTAIGDVAVDDITVRPLELGEELVTNGGFDNGTGGWSLYLKAAYVEGEVNGHSGVITRTSSSTAIATQYGVGVQEDTWYLYSADMYATATENLPKIYIDMNDTVGETELLLHKGGEWCKVYGLWYSGTNTWTDIRAVVENAFAGSTEGLPYIDNVSLRPVTVSEELVTDAGFENSGWQLGSGAAYQSGSYYLYGTKSLKLTDNATAIANGGKAIAVEPYTYYDFSAFSFRPGDKSVTGKIALQSADGTELASITGLYYNQTSWAPIPGTHAHYNKYGHWERIVGRWYSGDNTEIYLAAKTEGTGTVYFDEVTLRAYEDRFPSDNILKDGNMETSTILTAADIELTAVEKARVKKQYEGFLANDLAEFPTSVTIGGKTYNGFGEDFTLNEQKTENVRGGVKTVSVLTHTSGLVFTVESVLYEEYVAYDWTIYAENPTSENSPIISNWNGADIEFDGENPVLLGNGGDDHQYEPYTVNLSGNFTTCPSDGRGTNDDSSYFDLLYGNHGVLYAVGWPGQWEMTLDNSADARVTRMTMGQQDCNTYLAPGEKIRTPLAAFVHYDGRDKDKATNRWRRWLVDCNAPLVTEDVSGEGEKTLLAPTVFANTWVQTHFMVFGTEENQIAAMKRYVENDLPIDFWWLDAGWYYSYKDGKLVSPTVADDWVKVGTWIVDESRFPTKMKAISDYANKNGIKTMLWFEPERKGAGTELATDYSTVHTDWVLYYSGSAGGLVDLGNPEAYEWVKNRVLTVMDEGGISLYREDFNTGPIAAWRLADKSKDASGNRKGITENLYIQGHLSLWDAIREEHPDVPIDSCSGGGRRNDLESMRRGLPFHKTDWSSGNQTGHHAFTTEMSRWIPYFGDNSLEKNTVTKYARRRAVVTGSMMLEIANRDDQDWLLLRDRIDEHYELARCNYGDYYALIDWNRSNNEWAAWENYDVNLGEGYVIAFRRPNAPESVTVYPKGLEADAQYRVWFIDANDPKTVSGEELMKNGVTFTCPCGESSDILRIVKADKAPKDRNLIGKITEVNKDDYYAGALYADGDYNRFDIHFNMSLRDTALAVGAGSKVETDVAADYGDVITIDGATVAELLAADSTAVKMDYDLVNCILRVYVKAELMPADANHTVKLSGSATSDGNGNAVAETVYAYRAAESSWTAAVTDLDRSGETTLADALSLLKNIVDGNTVYGGDINLDGKQGLVDVLRLLKQIVE